MSNILTDFRAAIATQLQTNLQEGAFNVLSGERDGPATEKLACVFVPVQGLQEDSGDVNYARPTLIVRAWIPKPRTPRTQRVGVDPAPLEQLMVDLMTTLAPVATMLLESLFFRVLAVQPDYDDWGVQATLQGYASNPASILPNLIGA